MLNRLTLSKIVVQTSILNSLVQEDRNYCTLYVVCMCMLSRCVVGSFHQNHLINGCATKFYPKSFYVGIPWGQRLFSLEFACSSMPAGFSPVFLSCHGPKSCLWGTGELLILMVLRCDWECKWLTVSCNALITHPGSTPLLARRLELLSPCILQV